MAVSKVLQYAIGNSPSTTLSAGVSDSDTTAPLTSTTNFQAKTGEGLVLIDEGTATEELAYSTGLSGGSLAIPLTNRGLEGGSAQTHQSGASIKGVITAGMWNNIVDSLAKVFSRTTGELGSLLDANGNEYLDFGQTTSAINQVKVTNAAIGTPPIVTVAGGDTNIDLKLVGKGTGTVKKPASAVVQVTAAADNTATGDGQFYFTIPPELNGMVLSAVHARVITAGTTGTTDIQIANVTDAVDILSTKLTIDSAETGSDTAATPAVINASNDDVTTNDLLRIDVDAVSSTPAKGLIVRLTFGF